MRCSAAGHVVVDAEVPSLPEGIPSGPDFVVTEGAGAADTGIVGGCGELGTSPRCSGLPVATSVRRRCSSAWLAPPCLRRSAATGSGSRES